MHAGQSAEHHAHQHVVSGAGSDGGVPVLGTGGPGYRCCCHGAPELQPGVCATGKGKRKGKQVFNQMRMSSL